MLFSFSITGSHSEEYTEFCLYSFYFVLSIFALMIIEFELNSIKCVDFLFLLFKFWIILDKNATRKNARSCHVGVYNWCNGILTLLGNYQQFGMSFMRSRKLQIYIQEKKNPSNIWKFSWYEHYKKYIYAWIKKWEKNTFYPKQLLTLLKLKLKKKTVFLKTVNCLYLLLSK